MGRQGSRGMTLMELLIALGLGASLSAVIMQLFVASMAMQSVHSATQDLQQRSSYAQFLLRSAIRESAYSCIMDTAAMMAGSESYLEVLAAHDAAVSAVPGSHVLRLRTSDCEVPVHFYYIGRRGNDENNLAGLFRRRQRLDGSYFAAEELIEGVTAMTASVGITVGVPNSGVNVAYVGIDQSPDWSRVFSLELLLSVRHVTAAPARSSAPREMADNEITMRFSTALRQAELPGASGVTGEI